MQFTRPQSHNINRQILADNYKPCNWSLATVRRVVEKKGNNRFPCNYRPKVPIRWADYIVDQIDCHATVICNALPEHYSSEAD